MPTGVAFLSLWSLGAAAQEIVEEGIDAHGLAVRPTFGGILDAPYTFQPDRPPSWHAGAAIEVGHGLLYQYVVNGVAADGSPEVARYPLLATAGLLNLSGVYSPHERLAVGVTLPVAVLTAEGDGAGQKWFRTIGLSDPQLSIPVGLVLPSRSGEGFGLALIPTLNVAVGAKSRGLGDARSSAGVVIAPGWSNDRMSISANVGYHGRGWQSFAAIPAPQVAGAWFASVSAGVRVSDRLGLVFDGWMERGGSAAAIPEAPPDILTPAEVSLTVRGRSAAGVDWHATVATGLTGGIGSSEVRLLGGIGLGPRSSPTPAVAKVDRRVSVVVTDVDDRPIPGAVIWDGSAALATTDVDGRLSLGEERRPKWYVRSSGFEDAPVSVGADGSAHVVLQRPPVDVKVVVKDQQGRPVGASVSAVRLSRSAEAVGAQVVASSDGVSVLSVRPGTYRIEVGAPGFGAQQRQLIVPAGAPSLGLEVLLLPREGDAGIDLHLIDPDGLAIDTARLLLDGRPLGEVGSGDAVRILDIAAQPHRIEVQAEGYQPARADAQPAAGQTVAQDVVLRRLPGSVRVVVRGPNGPIPDAVVRIEGNPVDSQALVRLPPTPLGAGGERNFVLRPGDWQVVIASPSFGVQGRELHIDPGDNSLITVDVLLQPDEAGHANVRVQVIDPEGSPVERAEIAVDGAVVGRTSSAGSVELRGLRAGPRTLTVTGDWLRPRPPFALNLVDGEQEVVEKLDWKAGMVQVSAHSGDAPVTDGVARFSGGASVAPVALGPSGERLVQLSDGHWVVALASPTFGVRQAEVDVPPDSRELIHVDLMLSPEEGGESDLTLRVTDPAKHPVSGARVALDGERLGSTGRAGVLAVAGLDPGQRTLDVDASLHRPYHQGIRVRPGPQSADVRLDWAPGAVRFLVIAGSQPLTDAVIRLSGPSRMSPMPVDAEGSRILVLTPGVWQAVVVSPTVGLAQRELKIEADSRGLQTVTIALDGAPVEVGEVAIEVRDPNGRPVAGAEIRVNGVSKGQTRAGGVLLLPDVAPGRAEVRVDAPKFQPLTIPEFQTVPGVSQRVVTLAWVPARVSVSVEDAAGAPLDAELRFDGPAERAPMAVGPDGREVVELTPGTWQVMASAKDFGVRRQQVVVAPGDAERVVKITLGAAKVEAVGRQVVIKEQVKFGFDSAVIGAESAGVLDEVAAVLLAHPEIGRLEVQGHSDDVGDLAYNLYLSQLRADAVVTALAGRGVAVERLSAVGYGATRPVHRNDSESGRSANRRVQFEILGP
jgi:outer membrane protein OmpA-like peptidoglycan-associated protein